MEEFCDPVNLDTLLSVVNHMLNIYLYSVYY